MVRKELLELTEMKRWMGHPIQIKYINIQLRVKKYIHFTWRKARNAKVRMKSSPCIRSRKLI